MRISIQILLAFSIVLILSIIDSASNYVFSLKVEENITFLNKSQDVIRNSGRLNKSIIEMQSAFRGYLLTNDTIFLNDYNEGLREIPVLISAQQELVTSNKKQFFILQKIKALHKQWVTYATRLIEASKKSTTSDEALKTYNELFKTQLRNKVGKNLNDQISIQFTAFDRIEYKIRKQRSDNLVSSIDFTHTLSLIFFILTLIVGIGSTIYIMRSILRRIRTMVNQASRIATGDFATVNDPYHDELTSLSISLNTMSTNLNRNITELEKRNQELDKFAYVVSHDLKAPVRGIHNAVTWIEEDLGNELSPELKKYLAIIPQRTKRMEDLINGLLDYARLNTKSIPEKTDVNQLVSEIVEAVVPRKFVVHIEGLPVILADRLKLEQVFTNLISNAVKYTQSENAAIFIRCSELQEYFEFSVKDNGIGIEPEYHEKIFEIFQTLREKDEKESTGIGLAIVKRIIDDLHCTIKVISSLNGGSEFIFTWPKIKIQ